MDVGTYLKGEQFLKMHAPGITYSNSCCTVGEMGKNIHTHHHMSFAAVKTMNAVTMECRQRTAIDLLNTAILLIKMECKRLQKQKGDCWGLDNMLTPRGDVEYRV